MNEAVPLTGGRVTPGVVRIGETVRRPTDANSDFVHALDAYGFSAPPAGLVDELLERQREKAIPGPPRPLEAARWWGAQADWLEANRSALEEALY